MVADIGRRSSLEQRAGGKMLQADPVTSESKM